VMRYGVAQKSSLILRTGAKPGDILAVTGQFGKPSAGLRLLLNDCIAPEVLGKRLLKSVYLPKAHLAEGLALADCEAVSASMDSSDGLAWSLHELGRLSNVGFLLEAVPIAPEATEFAELNGLDACELALYGGEEYELVLTIKPECWEVAQAAVKAVGGQLICIGKATKDKQIQLEVDGKKSAIEPRGWEHFKSRV